MSDVLRVKRTLFFQLQIDQELLHWTQFQVRVLEPSIKGPLWYLSQIEDLYFAENEFHPV